MAQCAVVHACPAKEVARAGEVVKSFHLSGSTFGQVVKEREEERLSTFTSTWLPVKQEASGSLRDLHEKVALNKGIMEHAYK